MTNIHSKYDSTHKNSKCCALIFINNYIIICIDFMLSRGELGQGRRVIMDKGSTSKDLTRKGEERRGG